MWYRGYRLPSGLQRRYATSVGGGGSVKGRPSPTERWLITDQFFCARSEHRSLVQLVLS